MAHLRQIWRSLVTMILNDHHHSSMCLPFIITLVLLLLLCLSFYKYSSNYHLQRTMKTQGAAVLTKQGKEEQPTKKRRVNSVPAADDTAAPTSLDDVNFDCLRIVLSYVTDTEDLNSFAVCSKSCRQARENASLDKQEMGRSFCPTNLHSIVSVVQSSKKDGIVSFEEDKRSSRLWVSRSCQALMQGAVVAPIMHV